MATAPPLPVAKSTHDLCLLPHMANRHGLIAGATGTGKTVTLRLLTERLSEIGVPVFLADVKGDLSGLAKPGGGSAKLIERAQKLGVELAPSACPTEFWDVFGASGLPVRATISEMGPLLLGRLLGLNEVQNGLLSLVFKVADDEGLLLLDLKDLRAMLEHVAANAASLKTSYGNVASSSVGAIQRSLLALEQQGAAHFFGEPALELSDLLRTDAQGRGIVNVLVADELLQSPLLYATFLLWILSELFEQLPEVGDPDKPKLVFFFDEAHLLFRDAPKVIEQKVEQVVRLVRSKGVGVYFVTQSPLDIPEAVLGQLGNRVQHALRAFTPKDQKAVRAAAQTFRANPALDVERAIGELGVGEALVSMLDPQGVPGAVERALIYPPRSDLAPLPATERSAHVAASSLASRYATAFDRASAYEMLKARVDKSEPAPSPAPPPRQAKDATSEMLETIAKSAARTVGSTLGRQLVRGLLGSLLGGSRRR